MEPIKLSLNCILINDPELGGYTAFFAEFPDIVAEGSTEAEAQLNLMNTIPAVSQFKMQEIQRKFDNTFTSRKMDFEFETA